MTEGPEFTRIFFLCEKFDGAIIFCHFRVFDPVLGILGVKRGSEGSKGDPESFLYGVHNTFIFISKQKSISYSKCLDTMQYFLDNIFTDKKS